MGRKRKIEPRNDILIEVMITMPNGEVTSRDLRIANPGGCIMKSDLANSEKVYQNLTGGMARIYGTGHIK